MILQQLYEIARELNAGRKASRSVIISYRENLSGLRRYLARTEPRFASAFLKLGKAQAGILSQAEVERMMSRAAVSPSILDAWGASIENFVRSKVVPELEAALKFSAKDIEARLKRILKKGETEDAIRRWLGTAAGALITQLNDEMRASVNGVLRAGILDTPMSPYQLSRLLRPLIGLTERWSRAVLNRYRALTAAGLDAAKALAEAEKYAAFLHKVRAMNIARTELANAYNEGQLSALRATGENIRKRWATADDERLCAICAELDGEERDLNESFSNGLDRPTAHPSCRCSLEYVLIRP